MNSKTAKKIRKFCIVTGKTLDHKKLAPGANAGKGFYRKLKKLYTQIPSDYRGQYIKTLEGTIKGDKE